MTITPDDRITNDSLIRVPSDRAPNSTAPQIGHAPGTSPEKDKAANTPHPKQQPGEQGLKKPFVNPPMRAGQDHSDAAAEDRKRP